MAVKIRQNMKVTSASCCSCCMQNLRGEKVEWVRLARQGWADYVCQTRRIGDLAERLVGNDWRILGKRTLIAFHHPLSLSKPMCDRPWWAGQLGGGEAEMLICWWFISGIQFALIEKYFEEMIWSWLMHVRYLNTYNSRYFLNSFHFILSLLSCYFLNSCCNYFLNWLTPWIT